MRFLFMLLLFSSSAFAAGGVVNKGGDTVKCVGSPMGPGGLYTLDYALAIGRGASPQEFVRPPNWEFSRDRLKVILGAVSAELAQSFGEFSVSVEQKDRTFEHRGGTGWIRRWISHKGKPFQVDDIGDISRLPAACKFRYKPGPHPKFSIYRMIQRTAFEPRRMITYRYDKMKLRSLVIPLQNSILMVHEWLWDWTEDVEVNRQVNAFLHSRRIETMTPEQVAAELRALGLQF